MTPEYRRYPTPHEVLAVEQAARRARAEEFRRLLTVAARKLKAPVAHAADALARRFRRAHAPVRRGV